MESLTNTGNVLRWVAEKRSVALTRNLASYPPRTVELLISDILPHLVTASGEGYGSFTVHTLYDPKLLADAELVRDTLIELSKQGLDVVSFGPENNYPYMTIEVVWNYCNKHRAPLRQVVPKSGDFRFIRTKARVFNGGWVPDSYCISLSNDTAMVDELEVFTNRVGFWIPLREAFDLKYVKTNEETQAIEEVK